MLKALTVTMEIEETAMDVVILVVLKKAINAILLLNKLQIYAMKFAEINTIMVDMNAMTATVIYMMVALTAKLHLDGSALEAQRQTQMTVLKNAEMEETLTTILTQHIVMLLVMMGTTLITMDVHLDVMWKFAMSVLVVLTLTLMNAMKSVETDITCLQIMSAMTVT